MFMSLTNAMRMDVAGSKTLDAGSPHHDTKKEKPKVSARNTNETTKPLLRKVGVGNASCEVSR